MEMKFRSLIYLCILSGFLHASAWGKPVSATTVTGKVTCDGKGVPDVVVSDGVEVVSTDEKGCYSINSLKENGYVFVSVPGGYECELDGNVPKFWKNLKLGFDKKEVVDFQLKKIPNKRHAFLVSSDKHITRRHNDLLQYGQFACDINQTIDSLRKAGYYVAGIDLGDLTWDLHWTKQDMDPVKVKDVEAKINMPLYHVMGNHDNNPYFNTDREAEKTFESVFGPIYYSFNIGDAHYIVLDNIIYDSTGAEPGVMGSRTFKVDFTDKVMDWFRKDLATVKDKDAPLFVSMHAPLFHVDRSLMGPRYRLPQSEKFEEYLKEFSNVRVLSGHSHVINNIPLTNGNGIEHNIPAVSGTFWLTHDLSGNHLNRDGSPSGYLVCLMDSSKIEHIYYKTYDFPADYQFRAYDMNVTCIDSSKVSDEKDRKKYCYGYSEPASDNEVLINIFNYDPSWSVEVYEDGKKLNVIRLVSYDPLHVLSYGANQYATGEKISKGALTAVTTHLFKVKAKSSKSTLDIQVTDGYGKVYTQTMERPKAFHELMR